MKDRCFLFLFTHPSPCKDGNLSVLLQGKWGGKDSSSIKPGGLSELGLGDMAKKKIP